MAASADLVSAKFCSDLNDGKVGIDVLTAYTGVQAPNSTPRPCNIAKVLPVCIQIVASDAGTTIATFGTSSFRQYVYELGRAVLQVGSGFTSNLAC